MRLTATGQTKLVPLAIAKQFYEQALHSQPQLNAQNATEIQAYLLITWTETSETSILAQLCLRCFISWQITAACRDLAVKFGKTHGFSEGDLFPFVLDDDGKIPSTAYQSFGQQILQSYNRDRGNLAGWVHLRVKHHREINRLLGELGVYLISDWALLNDTQPSQLQRILQEFHQLSEIETSQACRLLQGYHLIYRQARLQQRQRFGLAAQNNPRSRAFNQRCLPPNPEQLQQIGDRAQLTLSHTAIFSQLQNLAQWIRAYRLHIRNGLLTVESLDYPSETGRSPLEQLANPSTSTPDSDTQEFLQEYRSLLLDCLQNAIATIINQRLQRRNREQSQQFLTGLQLFHCQNQSMSAIASYLGLKAQYQVTRLLNLKAFRADIRQRLLQELLQKVLQKAQNYHNPTKTPRDRLSSLETAVETALTEQIDAIIATAQNEASTAKKFTPHSSLFSQQLCQVLERWLA
ncbi:MAG: hypothetical protein SAJ12_21145 [Jaaginema sp. PMC 1079.18]|nr:hypothetical protein [Jaaginema sp. PMC 1080.18]MEC4853494.1 hypothetical protein [Jaaginema sp. PMC 1079.18]MEC4867758.1 hypothetical protein [Jaaginema sp. PMC 1078.18]